MNSWEKLENLCLNCDKCKLSKGRNKVVIGCGNKEAKLMFIGEGPGADEDAQGIPFVGKAGKLMNMALEGIGIKREKVYITNIVKCRPPQNRNPEKEEIISCMKYLQAQIRLVQPQVIVLLGNVALKSILGEEYGITKTRGMWIEKGKIKYMPTFHPAALLRDETKKILFWKDLKCVKKEMEKIQI